MNSSKYFLLTIDVEDWFQVENFKPWIPFSTWSERELRVEANTHRLLDLFDSITLPSDNSSTVNPKATFFILGWIAEKLPNLVQEIHNRGHEVASHGFNHNLCGSESSKKLQKDLVRSKKLLEDIIGSNISGYRAPGFSVDCQVLDAVEEAGYNYDSSYNSFALNPRYGKIDFSDMKRNGISIKVDDDFYELPISNFQLRNHVLPFGGGGYFRLFPLFLFISAVKNILKNQTAYIFYLHPWEIDPDQPRVREAGRLFKFRHYVNLDKTYRKLENLINHFKNVKFITCNQYISELA